MPDKGVSRYIGQKRSQVQNYRYRYTLAPGTWYWMKAVQVGTLHAATPAPHAAPTRL